MAALVAAALHKDGIAGNQYAFQVGNEDVRKDERSVSIDVAPEPR
jgi:hypothetical protein